MHQTYPPRRKEGIYRRNVTRLKRVSYKNLNQKPQTYLGIKEGEDTKCHKMKTMETKGNKRRTKLVLKSKPFKNMIAASKH